MSSGPAGCASSLDGLDFAGPPVHPLLGMLFLAPQCLAECPSECRQSVVRRPPLRRPAAGRTSPSCSPAGPRSRSCWTWRQHWQARLSANRRQGAGLHTVSARLVACGLELGFNPLWPASLLTAPALLQSCMEMVWDALAPHPRACSRGCLCGIERAARAACGASPVSSRHRMPEKLAAPKVAATPSSLRCGHTVPLSWRSRGVLHAVLHTWQCLESACLPVSLLGSAIAPPLCAQGQPSTISVPCKYCKAPLTFNLFYLLPLELFFSGSGGGNSHPLHPVDGGQQRQSTAQRPGLGVGRQGGGGGAGGSTAGGGPGPGAVRGKPQHQRTPCFKHSGAALPAGVPSQPACQTECTLQLLPGLLCP